MSMNKNRKKKSILLDLIYEAGKERGMSPRDICRACGKHPNYAAQLKNPSIETLELLADAVGGKIEFVKGKFNAGK